MYGFLLLIPFLIIRFSLLSWLDKSALLRAAQFAPMVGNERIAYYIYQISNIAILGYVCFLPIKIDDSWVFYIGICSYIIGIIMCIFSVIDFTKPSIEGVNQKGFYKLSRNPMYLSYFVLFMGFALLTQSLILGSIVLVFQVSAHWIILAEERWCEDRFGETYRQYKKKVRRYI